MPRIPALSAGDVTTYKAALAAGVTGYGTNTPPGGPAANETYIIGSSPTGAWAGNANKVAVYISSVWTFLPASGAIGSSQRNLRLGGASSDTFYLWDGSAWTAYAAPARLVDHINSIDPLPQYLMRNEATSGGGSASWGGITGTLSDQTDLNTALSGKAASSHTHAQSDVTNLVSDLALKAPLAGPTFTGTVTLPSTTSVGNVSSTELGYLDGVTSALQTQIDGKQASGSYAAASHTHAGTDITSGTVDPARLGSGSSITTKYLRGDSTWQTIAGGGDVTGPASSVDSEIALFDSTTGKLLKRASTTGLLKATSGVLSAATALTDYTPAPTLVAKLASDQATGANTTPVTLTNLVFTYATNSVYRIWFMGQISPAAATTGCGFQFDVSSAVTEISVQFFHQLASTGTQSGGHSIADDASVGVSSGLPGTGNYPVTGFGLIRTGANTGTAQLRFRSETTAVITAKAGLTLVVEKIA
jgi:hypothetical protein